MRFPLLLLMISSVCADPNECNPAKTCNVCAECCKSYITDGAPCDACVKQTCSAKKNECDPTKRCNVCQDCCKSYIKDGAACDTCVEQQCSAPNDCAHGTKSPTTGKCDCAGAWTGPKCDKYDPSISITQQVQMLVQVANQSQLMLNAQGKLDPPPLCRQNDECAGWGALYFGQGGQAANMPILHLSYEDATKTCLGKREPVEAIVSPQIAPHYAADNMCQVFPTIDIYEQYVHSQFAGDGGANGIYGSSFSEIYRSFFVGGKGLTVCSALLDIVEINLPTDPVTHKYNYDLDKFAAEAINSLPPPPNGTEAGAAWWQKYSPLFTTFFQKYGSSVITNAQIGGIVEQVSTYPGNTQKTQQELLSDAEIDFTNAAGIGAHPGTHDPVLTNQPLNCIGGDKALCTKDGVATGMESPWGKSVQAAPRLLHYTVVPLSQFFQDSSAFGNDVKASLEAGLNAYIDELQQTVSWSWDVSGIGGNCNSAPKSGTILETPGKSVVAASCNNNPCNITLGCVRDPDGKIQVQHTGCNGDTYTGPKVLSGCSTVTYDNKEDPAAGQCCHI